MTQLIDMLLMQETIQSKKQTMQPNPESWMDCAQKLWKPFQDLEEGRIIEVSKFLFLIRTTESSDLLHCQLTLLSQAREVLRIKNKVARVTLLSLFLERKHESRQSDLNFCWHIDPLQGQVRLSFSYFKSPSEHENNRFLAQMFDKIEECIELNRFFITDLFTFSKCEQTKGKFISKTLVKTQNLNLIEEYTTEMKREVLFKDEKYIESASTMPSQKSIFSQKTVKSFSSVKNLDRVHNLSDHEIYSQKILNFLFEDDKDLKRTLLPSLESTEIYPNNFLKQYTELIHNSLTKKSRDWKNFQKLFISSRTSKQQLLEELINSKQSKKIVKIKDTQYGAINLDITVEQPEKVVKLNQLLRSLQAKSKQFLFLENFFSLQNEIKQVHRNIVRLAVSKTSLSKFIQSNRNSISLETKLKIFTQIVGSVQYLWENLDILAANISLSSFSLTKGLCVKHSSINSLINYREISKQEKEELFVQIQNRLKENNLNLSRLFFFIFFAKDAFLIRPSQHKGSHTIKKINEKSLEAKVIADQYLQTCLYYGRKNSQIKLLVLQFLEILSNAKSQGSFQNDQNDCTVAHNLLWPMVSAICVLQS